jgi:hypothetical protein
LLNNSSSYLIIAGVNKAGTTSLFSYLNQHPELCGSSIKESCFFLPLRYGESIAPLDQYKQLFKSCNNAAYYMESTPGYFYGGQALIDAIQSNLGKNVKIILVFRDPVQRLLSFYKFQKSRLNLDQNLKLDDYIYQSKALDKEAVQLQKNNHWFGLEGGKYADYIEPWLTSFNENIKIIFFEQMKENPYGVLMDLANWLNLNVSAVANIKIEIENKTRYFNNRFLHHTALILNDSFEKFFRANPSVKKKLRNIYFFFNEKPSEEKINEKIINELYEFYKPYNENLKRILITNEISNLPQWLG